MKSSHGKIKKKNVRKERKQEREHKIIRQKNSEEMSLYSAIIY